MNLRLLPLVVILTGHLFLISSPAQAETVKDREGAVRADKAAMEKDDRWIYNDIEAAFAEAKKSGKPLLVVLRCVPCVACSGIDSQVLLQEKELAPLLGRFVCLRLINANAIDLAKFQFDYDLSFSAMVFHADGTVIGRFGSWTHQKDAQEKATAGFEAALRGALALHAGYPKNREMLAGKQGGPVPFQTPVEIPQLAEKYTRDLNWDGKVVQSCVHCHMIGEALRGSLREEGKPIPDELIFPQPPPETVGLSMDDARAARVTAVAAGSPAAAAGIVSGDEIVAVGGQTLVSIADLSWALHRAPAAGKLTVLLKSGGKDRLAAIELKSGWRRKADISRRAGTWGLRAMAAGGLALEPLPAAERAALSLAPDALALRVHHLGEYGKHAAAKNAGWRKGDVLVEIDGRTGGMTEGELLAYLVQSYRPGESAAVTVVRDGQKVSLRLPVQ